MDKRKYLEFPVAIYTDYEIKQISKLTGINNDLLNDINNGHYIILGVNPESGEVMMERETPRTSAFRASLLRLSHENDTACTRTDAINYILSLRQCKNAPKPRTRICIDKREGTYRTQDARVKAKLDTCYNLLQEYCDKYKEELDYCDLFDTTYATEYYDNIREMNNTIANIMLIGSICGHSEPLLKRFHFM